MAIKIIKGSDKRIIVRVTADKDPYDLTGVSQIRACFAGVNNTTVYKYYLAMTGDTTSGSDIISALAVTSNIKEGDPVYGSGIPSGAKVLKTPTSTTSPTAAGTIKISIPATLTATGVSLTIGFIEVLNAVIGKLRIHLDETATDALESGEAQNFEIKIVKGEDTAYVQFPESLNVVERFC